MAFNAISTTIVLNGEPMRLSATRSTAIGEIRAKDPIVAINLEGKNKRYAHIFTNGEIAKLTSKPADIFASIRAFFDTESHLRTAAADNAHAVLKLPNGVALELPVLA